MAQHRKWKQHRPRRPERKLHRYQVTAPTRYSVVCNWGQAIWYYKSYRHTQTGRIELVDVVTGTVWKHFDYRPSPDPRTERRRQIEREIDSINYYRRRRSGFEKTSDWS